MTTKQEWKVPTRLELEERVAEYLEEHSNASRYERQVMACELVRIFNQWALAVVKPETLEEAKVL